MGAAGDTAGDLEREADCGSGASSARSCGTSFTLINYFASKRLPACGLGRVLHVNPLKWDPQAAGCGLSNLVNLFSHCVASWPMSLQDGDEDGQLLGANCLIVLRVGTGRQNANSDPSVAWWSAENGS